MLTAPVEREVRTDTRPNPLGFCLPIPTKPPTACEEKMVGRGVGR
jgi:hypothetical protein